jgi:hypothetical protein
VPRALIKQFDGKSSYSFTPNTIDNLRGKKENSTSIVNARFPRPERDQDGALSQALWRSDMRATSHLFRTGFEQYCRDLKGLRGKSARYLGVTVKYPTGDQLEAHIKQRTMIPHQGPSKNLLSNGP